jgi:hypothetical protein
VRRAEFAELQKLLLVQDAALMVIALVLLVGIAALLLASGERNRDIRDTPPGKPQTRRRTM